MKQTYLDFQEQHLEIRQHIKPASFIKGKKTLIIAQCSKSKQEGNQYFKAKDLYKGLELKWLKEYYNEHMDNTDLFIFSAGYGLINAEDEIKPYDLSFNNLSNNSIGTFSKAFRIRDKINTLIQEGEYTDVYILFGSNYLKAIELKEEFNFKGTIVHFFVPPTLIKSKKKPVGTSVNLIPITVEMTKTYKSPIIALKGRVLVNMLNGIYLT